MSSQGPERDPSQGAGQTRRFRESVLAVGMTLLTVVGPACTNDDDSQVSRQANAPVETGLSSRFDEINASELSPSDAQDHRLVVAAQRDARQGRLNNPFRRIRLVDNGGQIDYRLARDAVEAVLVGRVAKQFHDGYIQPFQALEAVAAVDDEGEIREAQATDVIEGEIVGYAASATEGGVYTPAEALGIADLLDGRGTWRRIAVRDGFEAVVADTALQDFEGGLASPVQAFMALGQIDNAGEFTLEMALDQFGVGSD